MATVIHSDSAQPGRPTLGTNAVVSMGRHTAHAGRLLFAGVYIVVSCALAVEQRLARLLFRTPSV